MNVPDWLTLSVQRGQQKATVEVVASPNNMGYLREDSILVSTTNGAHQKRIRLRQHGDSRNKVYLNVSRPYKRWLNGEVQTEGGIDSIELDTNVPWTIKGSDWLNVYDGEEQLYLTGWKLYHGSKILRIIPKEDNGYPFGLLGDKEGFIRISSPYSEKSIEIPIVQLGVGRVEPDKTLIMAHGIVTTFKFGTRISYLDFNIFEGEAQEQDVTYSKAREWDYVEFDESCYIYCSSLKPNTEHEICMRTSYGGYYYDALSRFKFITETDENQPNVEISDVSYDNRIKRWTFKTIMNPFTAGYYMAAFSGTRRNEMNLAYELKDFIENYPDFIYTCNSNATWQVTGENKCIVAWAFDANGKLSNVLATYDFVKPGYKSPKKNVKYGGTVRRDIKIDTLKPLRK